MYRDAEKNAAKSSHLLVLVLTVCTVMALSLVSQAQADPTAAAAQVVEDTQAAAGNASAGELSASIPSRWAASPLACIAGFVVVLAFVAGGLLLYRRERRRGRRAPQGRHSYIPRADMAFSGRNRV